MVGVETAAAVAAGTQYVAAVVAAPEGIVRVALSMGTPVVVVGVDKEIRNLVVVAVEGMVHGVLWSFWSCGYY